MGADVVGEAASQSTKAIGVRWALAGVSLLAALAASLLSYGLQGSKPVVVPHVSQARAPEAGGMWTSPETRVVFRYVPGGTFQMGSPESERDRQEADEAQREVHLGGFFLMETEVTQALWASVMNESPATSRQRIWDGQEQGPCKEYEGLSLVGEDYPVICVSWYDAVAFANALSEVDGLTPAYRLQQQQVARVKGADGYRLPTEAQWEWAARGSMENERYAGADSDSALCAVANIADRSARSTLNWTFATDTCDDGHAGLAPVGSFRSKSAHGYHLLDMSGNVWEWTEDDYIAKHVSRSARNPYTPMRGPHRAVRGGAWNYAPRDARVAGRAWSAPDGRYINLGVRLVKPANQTDPAAVER